MLVLSRRIHEEIHFPAQNIRVRILGQNSNSVRIGIDAPRDVLVVRAELVDTTQAHLLLNKPDTRTHALRNQLNKMALHLHTFHQLWRSGQLSEADAVLERVFSAFESIEETCLQNDPVTKEKQSSTPTRRCRSLLVEDDVNERELLAGLLNLSGCECDTVSDGQEALEYLSSHEPPDFVLLDMGLPQLSGPQMLGKLRNDPRWSKIKVFAVSGSTPTELGISIGNGGVDAWFHKPLHSCHLSELIRRGMETISGKN